MGLQSEKSAVHTNLGKPGSSFKSANLTSAIRALPSLRKGHKTKPCTWDLAKNVKKLKNTDKATFYSPIEAKTTPAPTSKSPEEREFVVDSGASLHMLSIQVLSSDEMETLRRSRNPTTVVTASGEVQTNEEAHVCVHDLDLFVTVQILDDTPAVPLLRKLPEEHGYAFEWASCQKAAPNQTK